MTIDMAFECLLVSEDWNVVTLIKGLLTDLSISTAVCPTPSKALDHLSYGSTDLLIVDWQTNSPELLEQVNRSNQFHKTTVIVLAEGLTSCAMAGTHSFLRKPITQESGARSLKQAYSKLLQEYRRYTRYALMESVVAKNKDGHSLCLTVTNIGEGGIGVITQRLLLKGEPLSFSLLLPGTDVPIKIQANVLWMRQYGAAGCEFAHLSDGDYWRLHEWLEQKSLIKKPLVEL